MDTDLMTLGDNAALLFGVKQRGYRRHVKGALDPILGEQIEDPWHADAVAELPPGQAPDRLASVSEIARLVIGVKRQGHRTTGAAWPLGRPQPAPSADAVDKLAPLF